eukprot:TRINITY_DN962_c0_g1_i1.p1 TRINITY_DN962_c0_g1~~TRINITY_DN962_c0_g1_i1.p1  ORF type:complete len:455 (-),score=166.91 TRINITY_DN962_c0_g1_i1:132-1454(-)
MRKKDRVDQGTHHRQAHMSAPDSAKPAEAAATEPSDAAASTATTAAVVTPAPAVVVTAPVETKVPEIPAAVKEKLAKQVMFYFCDSNLRSDKFMREQLAKDPAEGKVPLATIVSFNRVRVMLSGAGVPAAAHASSLACVLREMAADTLVVSDDNTTLRRKQAVAALDVAGANDRTLYVKGWPKDKEPTIDEVQEFFSAKVGPVALVRLRRFKTKEFKGTMLIEFETKEAVAKALQEKPKLHDTVEMQYMAKADWEKEKTEEYEKKKAARKAKGEGEDDKKPDSKDRKRGAQQMLTERTFNPGMILKLEGVPADTDSMKLKEEIAKIERPKFVDVGEGGVAHSRFLTPEAAQKVREHLSKEGNTLFGVTMTASVLEGEAEKQYWAHVWEAQEASRKKGGRRKGGFKKKGFKRQRTNTAATPAATATTPAATATTPAATGAN